MNRVNFAKDFKDPNFWLQLSQKQMENPDGEGPHSLINYLKNGLRNIPLEPLMLYNFAVAHERVGCDRFALLFFKFARMARLNWTDAWFGEAVTNFKLKLFEQSS